MPYCAEPRYLGIKLDRFCRHLESKSKKLTTRVGPWRRLAGWTWGAGATTLRIAILALVHSAAEYCSLVWCIAHKRLLSPPYKGHRQIKSRHPFVPAALEFLKDFSKSNSVWHVGRKPNGIWNGKTIPPAYVVSSPTSSPNHWEFSYPDYPRSGVGNVFFPVCQVVKFNVKIYVCVPMSSLRFHLRFPYFSPKIRMFSKKKGP